MAGRIAGITIEIGGDTTDLQKSLKSVDSQLKKTQSNLKDIDKLLKLDPNNTELLRQKQQELEKAIGLTKTRLDELKNAQSQVSEGSAEWDALQREIIATEQSLGQLEGQYAALQAGTDQTAQKTRSLGEAVGCQLACVGSRQLLERDVAVADSVLQLTQRAGHGRRGDAVDVDSLGLILVG